MVSRLHQLLLELIPGGAKKDLSARQAKAQAWAAEHESDEPGAWTEPRQDRS
jgi:hypothetical protein